jgi:hypothetical protein
MAMIHSVLLSLHDSYHAPIGSILTKWATLEHQLQAIIWAALDLDNKAGRVLTVGMGSKTLVGVIKNLHRRWVTDPTIKQELNSLANAVREHSEMRNYLAHGIWTIDPINPDDTPWLNYMKDGEHRILPGAEQVTPEQLAEYAKIIATLNERAEEILLKIKDAPPPWPDISDEQSP